MATKDDQYRIEKDSMGEMKIPADSLYAAQTQRAVDNFKISGIPMPGEFIQALGLIKSCAAQANHEIGLLDAELTTAITTAAEQIVDGQHAEHFPIDIFQTGSGTSSNMNANEVIANIASQQSGISVHPNDHVNMSQSSNDVIPTAIHVSACIAIERHLLPALDHAIAVVDKKAASLDHKITTGRTHLMDAMPVSLGQVLGAWKAQLSYGKQRIEDSLQRLRELAQGGTAVGSGVNCPKGFPEKFCKLMATKTGVAFVSKPDKFEALSAQDAAVECSGQLKTLAVSLIKIANDLRWMNSGPLAGIGEIALPSLQPGSSIMPGKVNPVIPEAVAMAGMQVIGNDTAITLAGQSGNFQLNVTLPLIAHNLLQSIEILANSCTHIADKAIEGFIVNDDNISNSLSKNPILVTSLNRVIGYEKGAAIAKKAYKEQRPVLDVVLEETDLTREEAEKLLDPAALAKYKGD